MSQPSAQGIASLFRGNPAPLQQRIQQEQQGKPGLPPDLHELMALNIVTNETDAMAKQKAMDQLAQMQGPQGKPPTVMESVREQARQKMQAQALQAQQQQQAMQAMAQQAGPGPVPEGTQFAQAQPSAQGIDDLPVEFGLAGGGIVAFKKGGDEGEEYETRIDKLYRENREDAERPERKKDEEGLLKALAFLSAPLAAAGDVVAAPFRGLYGMTQHGKTSLTPLMDARTRFLASSENAPASESAAREVSGARQATPPAVDNRAAINATDAAMRSAAPTAKPVSDLKALAEADARKQQASRPPAPVAQAAVPIAPAAPTASMMQSNSPLADEAQRLDVERMQADPQAAAANREAMYQSRVGAPDTTQRDAMIKQLQEERARQVGPQDSFGQLMEYLGQIAATPRGMSSFEAGAAGARGVRGLEEQRAQKRFDLGSKIIEQEQGKIDASRQYAKEVYGVGEKEYDRIFKEKYEAVGRVGTTEMERKKLAQQAALKELELTQQATLRREEMAKDIRVASIGQEGRRADEQRNQQYLNLTERARKLREAGDTAGADRVQAQADDILKLKGGTGTAGVGAGRNKIMERRQEMQELAAMSKNEMGQFSDADAKWATGRIAELARENAKEGSGGGGGGAFTVTAGGKTYTFPTQEAANKFKAEAGVK